MHPQTRKALRGRISCGYTKPTPREFAWMRKNEGIGAARTVHLGLYGEEVEGRICHTWDEFKKAARMTRPGWVSRYVDKFKV